MPKNIYNDTKFEIIQRSRDWQQAMDLGHYVVGHTFLDISHPTDDSIVAETSANWQYREADIRWYMDKVITLSDSQLNRTIVHELTHVHLSPLERYIKSSGSDHLELVVEGLTRAFMEIRNGKI